MDYYIDTLIDDSGRHQIHKQGCEHKPKGRNRLFLGNVNSYNDAIKIAKDFDYHKISRCSWCCDLNNMV